MTFKLNYTIVVVFLLIFLYLNEKLLIYNLIDTLLHCELIRQKTDSIEDKHKRKLALGCHMSKCRIHMSKENSRGDGIDSWLYNPRIICVLSTNGIF